MDSRRRTVLSTVLEEISRSEKNSNLVQENERATELLRNFYLEEMKKENWKESIIEMGSDILEELNENIMSSPNKSNQIVPVDTTYIMHCKDLNKNIELKSGRMYLVGRSSECDLQLSTYGISRLHAIIFITEQKTIVIDFWSQMGTKLSTIRLDDDIEHVQVNACSSPSEGRKALVLNRTDQFIIEFLSNSKVYQVKFSSI